MIATGVVLPEGNPNHVFCNSSGAAMRMKSSKLELIAAARPDELPLTRTAMTRSPHAAVIIALACGFLPVTASNGVMVGDDVLTMPLLRLMISFKPVK